MSTLWHPIAAVYLDEPRTLATPVALRMLLAAEGRASIVYAGDRMWPAVRHGQKLTVQALRGSPRRGDTVLALDAGVLDVARISATGGSLSVDGDADPSEPRKVAASDLFGALPQVPPRRGIPRALRRAFLELAEAAGGTLDAAGDPAESVREKYDVQAAYYARGDAQAPDPRVAAVLRERVRPGAKVLVAGCGTGREAFAIEALGYPVHGVDFSPRMVEFAAAAAKQRGSRATFTASDLRLHEEKAASLGAIVFTYDVYSFIPGAAARVAMLSRLRGWLQAGGILLLSARRARGFRDRTLLTLQWLGKRMRGRAAEWGDSHTRWLDASGSFHRSYIRVLTDAQLDREAARAGFRRVSWEAGHGLFVL